MDCRTFHRQLEDYLEDGLDFPARFGMERHARQCFACEKVVTEALGLRHMVREIQRVGAPANFETRLLARIQAEESRRRFRWLESFWLYGIDRFPWRTAGVVAATVVLVAGTIVSLHFGFGPYRSAPAQPETMVRTTAPIAGGDNSWSADKAVAPGPGAMRPADTMASAVQIPVLSGNRPDYFGSDPWATPYVESGDSDYVEYLIPVSGDRQLVMRLPKIIRMRYDQPTQEYFIRNISH
jgi:hypothetical protein